MKEMAIEYLTIDQLIWEFGLQSNIKEKLAELDELDDCESLLEETPSVYPLTDLGYAEDGSIIIDVVCTGFSIEDINITMLNDKIEIFGTPNQTNLTPIRYVHQNIVVEDFKRTIKIPKSYMVSTVTATLNKGILTIVVTKNKSTRKNIVIN